jgi:glutamate-1-semialdehyde 2,1-aminomutase
LPEPPPRLPDPAPTEPAHPSNPDPHSDRHGIDRHRLEALLQRERATFEREHPRSLALAEEAHRHYLFGVPMHWMRDWPTPVPLAVHAASGHRLVTADGTALLDFCLGDSGAMYGHSPRPVAEAIATQASAGLTAMLPSELTARVGQRLARVFGLPRWQVTLSASDANRFALRWARAVTGRPKVLVFDGCYHGTVDDTLVDMAVDAEGGFRTVARASLLGQVHELSHGTVVVPFNDAAAVRAALGRGDVACVLTEPALTNCGLVLPAPGFLAELQDACRATGTLLALDETHTLSTGWGGCTRAWGLRPDLLVVGKAVAAGLPCAVYGFSDDLAARMEAAKRAAPDGHSGIGTTLSASLLAMAALDACLAHVMTPATCERMEQRAAQLEQRLVQAIRDAGLPWCVSRLGARMELQFGATPPRDAAAARAGFDDLLERALHLFQLNRGVLLTPFHNMLLVAPDVSGADIATVVSNLDAFIAEVRA